MNSLRGRDDCFETRDGRKKKRERERLIKNLERSIYGNKEGGRGMDEKVGITRNVRSRSRRNLHCETRFLRVIETVKWRKLLWRILSRRIGYAN